MMGGLGWPALTSSARCSQRSQTRLDGQPRRAGRTRRHRHRADRSAPHLDAGGVATPQGARARRAHLADTVGQVAREPPPGRSTVRRGRLDRSLPALLGLLPDPSRCPPCRGAGRRTRNGPDGQRPQGPRQPGALMETETRQLAISRVFDAPRELVYRAFTDPDHLAEWWGPMGNSLPREEIDFDVRPGGYQRWTEVSANDPDLRIHIYVN